MSTIEFNEVTQIPVNPEHVKKSIDERMNEFDQQTQIIRAAINTVYDIQKLRIATGNRIVQSFIQAAGVNPSESIDNMDKEIKSMISILVKECSLITDTYIQVYNSKGRITKAIEYLGEDLYKIKTETDYQMINIYINLLKQEAEAVKIVDRVVKSHPMWDAFFKDVEGCGPLMSAVCLSRLNPFKARHVSSFWRYAGLDVVWEPYKTTEGEEKFFTKRVHVSWDDERPSYNEVVVDAYADDAGIHIQTENAKFIFPMVEDDTIIKPNKRNGLIEPKIVPGAKIIDFCIDDLEETEPTPIGRYVGRSKRHLIDVEYTDKNGEIKTKRGISYNPFLKTKLMGVLADSFIKRPGSKYEQIYRGYRNRMENDPRHYGKTAAHKHMAAKRYAIKMFLQDMWVVWRTIEGCEVSKPYAEAKLGLPPHGYNGLGE